MTSPATIDHTAELERKIDYLTDQIALLAEEATARRQSRATLAELQADLTPIAMRAIEQSAAALDGAQIDPVDLFHLAIRVANNAKLIESMMVQLESMNELIEEVTPIIGLGVELAITKVGELDERGYFEFATAGLGIADRIVTNFTKEDVEALGENIVQMLGLVKDVTQPEMLAVADRLLDAVQRQASAEELEPEKPPSLIALAWKVRDPEIRRGMARALNTLKAVSATAAPSPDATVNTTETRTSTGDTTGGA